MQTDPLILEAMLTIFSDQADAAQADKLKSEIAGRMRT